MSKYKDIINKGTAHNLKTIYEQNYVDTVRHGRWNWVDGVRCSICNYKLQTTGLPSYCPNCGAKMDEVRKNETEEPRYCDRNICASNEVNGVSCDECEIAQNYNLEDDDSPCRECEEV